jgi:hypothetical protein
MCQKGVLRTVSLFVADSNSSIFFDDEIKKPALLAGQSRAGWLVDYLRLTS